MTLLDFPPAPLGRRLAALLYDGLVVIAILFVAAYSVLPFTGGRAVPPGTWWFELYLLVLVYLYYAWSWTRGGQTLGQRAWRLHVIDRAGGRLGWTASALRFSLAVLTCVPAGLGLWWCLFDAERATLYERLSHTRMVFRSA
jgi:uncharacterized RDD family membrane protein YckC